jgi:tripeptide aminopeptidase
MPTASAAAPFRVDTDAALARLMYFLSVEGVTGREKAIGKAVERALLDLGVPRRAIRFDDANSRIPVPTETGNLIVQLPGTRPGPRRLFMTHLDTVPLCAGAAPVRKGNRIVPAGRTALGGDNRTGVACLVTLVATLLEQKVPHPPLTVLFTVREESGLYGARHLNPDDLGGVTEGYNVDGGTAAHLTVGAIGAMRWTVEVFGKASHAGVHPEHGVSATAVASLAISDVVANGWFGKVVKGRSEGTSNVGVFGGPDGKPAGDATNVVTDYVFIRGESRSHEPKFVKAITSAYKDAFQKAAGKVLDAKGHGAKVKFTSQLDYHPFKLKAASPVVTRAQAAAEAVGLVPVLKVTNGGLDANWLVRHGVPCVTFGAGQNKPHTVEEYVELAEFEAGCRLAVALAATE